MGNNGCFPNPPIPPIPPKVLEIIKVVSSELITDIPADYTEEHARIVNEMRKSEPEPYEGLLFSDYPNKNLSKVNALSLRHATSEDMKQRASDKINEQIKPELEKAMANMNKLESDLLQKAVEKTIEQAIEQAVDKAVEQIKKKDETDKENKDKNDQQKKKETS